MDGCDQAVGCFTQGKFMKHIHRFFVSKKLTAGSSVCLDEDDSFHAVRVLRLKPGDALELVDPDGCVFEAEVTGGDGTIEAMPLREIESKNPVAGPALTVVQVLPSGRKMDLIVEKLSELGVARLLPVFSEKSVARPAGGDGKLQRWRRIARSAAAQSKRVNVMQVEEPVALGCLLEDKPGPFYVLSTEVQGKPLGDAMTDDGKPVMLVAGPEAGFSDAEIDRLGAAGAVFMSLGPHVLRAETASIVAVALVLHRLGELG